MLPTYKVIDLVYCCRPFVLLKLALRALKMVNYCLYDSWKSDNYKENNQRNNPRNHEAKTNKAITFQG